MSKQLFKGKYKGFEVDISITAIKKTGVRHRVAKLESVSLDQATTMIDIYRSFLPQDKRFGSKNKKSGIDSD